ncbi:L-lactate permease [Quadrisphaera sp. DSM 44207]|uniref:L-lactate permease n=1 Tax=Quadrisphaera sp. DSM 44207 TaxID=1881057 RepID=UPI0008833CBB|nr:L-lactate permease [Quadrisphaera sp. DSM 44207]SDQ42342.1 lactate permease [Quadrisphaera sp. DSM 44207]
MLTYQQDFTPVADSLALSAIFAALPLVTIFVLLGALKVKAQWAALASLAVSVLVAVLVYRMPVGTALNSGLEGAAFGFFPIMWIVINAIWVYNLTVATGHFDVLRRSFGSISADQRIQAVIIAFCFGGLLEALAGFGTPVAISSVMLLALGFTPLKAASIALVANTAPVAYGALATPIITMGRVTGLEADAIGAVVGRQTPVLALFVPLVLVFMVDGRRGLRQTWLPAVVGGVVFAIGQFLCANYFVVELTDIVASLLAAAAIVVLLRFWQPAEVLTVQTLDEREMQGRISSAEDAAHRVEGVRGRGARSGSRAAGASVATGGSQLGSGATAASGLGADRGGRGDDGAGSPAPVAAADRAPVDPPAEVLRAYAPYAMIILVFSIAQVPAVKALLANGVVTFPWPGLDVLNPAGEPVTTTTFNLNWLPAGGTLVLISGLLTIPVLKLSPGRALRAYGQTYDQLKWAIVTVMAVLGLAYVMNLSGQTITIGQWMAGAGGLFALLSPVLGWLGVAVTGSDTSSNALFGSLQIAAAADAGLDPLLLASANTSGGVLGKMISPQNLAIAAAAVGLAGQEGVLFRKVVWWSLGFLVVMALLVYLQSTAVLGWMLL